MLLKQRVHQDYFSADDRRLVTESNGINFISDWLNLSKAQNQPVERPKTCMSNNSPSCERSITHQSYYFKQRNVYNYYICHIPCLNYLCNIFWYRWYFIFILIACNIVDIDVESRFGSIQALSYNPRERALFGWDNNHPVFYPVFFQNLDHDSQSMGCINGPWTMYIVTFSVDVRR